jgi:SPP1 gp7 family putative phage head morphogenesis protein
MELSRRDATRLVRTQFTSVVNTAQLAVYDAHAAQLEAVQWLSTLDGRTSLICIARSGLRYSLPDHEPIGHEVVFLGGPPAHWHCRSVLIPVVTGADRADDETFAQFLDRRGAAFQDEILGPARARLYRSGALSSLKMLLDAATGRPLTLDELGA